MKKALRPGNWYAIPAPRGRFYLAEVGCGGDFLFVDQVFPEPTIPAPTIRHFLRLMVAYPSIRRAGWRHIGEAPPTAMALEPGLYLQKPVGAEPLRYNLLTGETVGASQSDSNLEDLAAWDAVYHIAPLLGYHFYREDTPFKNMVRTVL